MSGLFSSRAPCPANVLVRPHYRAVAGSLLVAVAGDEPTLLALLGRLCPARDVAVWDGARLVGIVVGQVFMPRTAIDHLLRLKTGETGETGQGH